MGEREGGRKGGKEEEGEGGREGGRERESSVMHAVLCVRTMGTLCWMAINPQLPYVGPFP